MVSDKREKELQALVCRIRGRIFEYNPDKYEQAARIIDRVKNRMAGQWKQRRKAAMEEYLNRQFS